MKSKKQKYVVVKHVLAASVEEAIKNQTKFPVVFCDIFQPEQQKPQPVGFQ